MRKLIRPLVALTGALFACLALAGAARADTYPVDDPSDLPDAAVGNGICATAAGTCTLRAAIQEANAHAGPDTVTVPAGTYLLTRTGQFEGNAVTGDLDLRDTITIAGAGRDLTVVDGNLTDRVFDVFPAVSNSPMTATLSGLTIRRGGSVSTGCGMDVNGSQTRVSLSQADIRNGACLNSFGYGGIYFSNAYLLSMDDVVIDNNSGYYGGGGIYANGGRVVLSSTLIINNASQNNGGGASLQNGFVSINRSAIVDNRSSYQGGGLYLYYASGGITSTTIAGNFASSNGGGLYFYYSNGLSFGWNTIARNTSASFGGGVYNGFGTMTMRATLLGANTAANGPDAYCYGSLVSQGNSLIGDVTQCASSYYYSAGAGDIINVNPGVGAPISLGGTRVVPLVYGSRAIDAGGATCPAIDQRSQPRPADGNADGSAVCDIGAYESQGSGELSLAGFVYADLDLNGAWNMAAEPGVPGVTITLADLGSGLIITSTTAQDGSFAFGALTTGTFVLREYQPAAYDDGVDALGTAGGALGNDVMTISLVAATPALSYTFGEYAFAVVSGTVYGDSNGNGAYDPPIEGGVFNVTMGLAGTTARGLPLSLFANTDGAGTFSFFLCRPACTP